MSLNQTTWLTDMIKSLQQDSLFKSIILSAGKKYSINLLNLETLQPSEVFQLISKLNKKQNQSKLNKTNPQIASCRTFWVLNEFRVFSWVSVCYASLQGKQLNQFNGNDYCLLSQLFPRKSTIFLQYHLKSLLKQKMSHQKWNSQEINLLVSIVQMQQATVKWSQISFLLFSQSAGKFCRTAQNCREQWVNHLDPQVNRRQWSFNEDLKLFRAIKLQGTKWARISKLFGRTRTQHMVKNRYNSIYKRCQNKSQRAGSQKIIDKIIEDLERKIKNLKFKRQRQSQIEKTLPLAQVHTEDLQLESSFSGILTLMKNESQTQQKIISQTSHQKQLFSPFFDLNQVMFSEKQIPITPPSPALVNIQMREIQFFSTFTSEKDQYINSLFLQ